MQNVLLLLQLVPEIIKLVQAAEAAIPMSGNGKAKLDMVLGILTAAHDGVSQMLPQVTSIINTVVNTMNACKVFKK